MFSRIISQNHTPGISLLTKNVTISLHSQGVGCSPFPWNFMGNPEDGEKSCPTAKNLLISPIRKFPLNNFKSFAIHSSVDWSGFYLQVHMPSWLETDLIINPPCRTVPQSIYPKKFVSPSAMKSFPTYFMGRDTKKIQTSH